jgi:hypothetical protein
MKGIGRWVGWTILHYSITFCTTEVASSTKHNELLIGSHSSTHVAGESEASRSKLGVFIESDFAHEEEVCHPFRFGGTLTLLNNFV